MRKVIYGAANSLDNFIARADGGVDWLLWGDEAARYMKEFWKRIDTVLMGRKTYEVALEHGGGANPYKGVKTYVFSRTLKEVEGAELVKRDAAGFVRKLKQREGKDICVMGGGRFAKTLLEAGLVDEVGVNVHPVLLGSGVPMFREMNRETRLKLERCERFGNDCVLLTYSVLH